MRTDDLIAALARNAGAIEPATPRRRFVAALGWGAFGSVLAMALALGVRDDVVEALRLPMFWIKLVYPAALLAAALLAALRFARPGAALRRVPGALAAPVLAMGLLAAVDLLRTAPVERVGHVLGSSWNTCPLAIASLSVPLFVASFWAMRGLAPTRLAPAGAAAGLIAGAGGALVYALYCTEMTAPFIAVWYLLGMLTPAALGALLGPRLLRW